ncbi:calmodulin-binding protein 60 A-like isoform X2 [Primulina huaijiensis]|uniref:calmodulin-binding protein 60 A-like isoform X2 n=1 Tax=Primulina huaijiensis TaxID=1492673 RepID=UPI003CC74471
MSSKRQQREEGTSLDETRPRKTPSSAVLDVMKLCRCQNLDAVLEPLIRRVVREEVDIAFRKYLIAKTRNYEKDTHISELRSLRLQFSKAISLPVFTGTLILGKGSTTMEVNLIDALTREIVFDGLESSAKVEIVVLEGDFIGDGGDNWTLEEFTNNIVRERERKKSLLSGEVITILKNGKGSLGDVSFTDNSSWTRSRRFRLGARLVDNFGDIRVREAISEPFVVRDHRGELYKKHHPPSLVDEVWRLENIGKDGAFHRRLSNENVNSVQDFLILHFSDPTKLRNILGVGISAKKWEATVEHAQTCTFDRKLYYYDSGRSLQKNGAVFNMVGQVMGMISNGQYVLADKLTESEKDDARELVLCAFRNRDKIVTFDEASTPTSSCLSFVQSSPGFPSKGRDLSSPKIGENYSQPNATSPDCNQSIFSIGGVSNFDDCLHDIDPLDNIGYDQSFSFPFPATDSLICDTDSIGPPLSNYHLQYFEADCSNLESSPDLLSDMDALIPDSVIQINGAKWRWNVLISIVRWCCYLKRIVARKTRVKKISRRC